MPILRGQGERNPARGLRDRARGQDPGHSGLARPRGSEQIPSHQWRRRENRGCRPLTAPRAVDGRTRRRRDRRGGERMAEQSSELRAPTASRTSTPSSTRGGSPVAACRTPTRSSSGSRQNRPSSTMSEHTVAGLAAQLDEERATGTRVIAEQRWPDCALPVCRTRPLRASDRSARSRAGRPARARCCLLRCGSSVRCSAGFGQSKETSH